MQNSNRSGKNDVNFDDLKSMMITEFRDVTPCCLVDVWQHFGLILLLLSSTLGAGIAQKV
jgi:hypothetical protein